MTNSTPTRYTKKHWWQSKMLAFNGVVAVAAVLLEQSETLRVLLSDRDYMIIMLIVAVVNAYLRTVTTQPLHRKEK